MSQLMQMRQRIKTIETIEKITHAMRLIAMSSHTRLKSKQLTLKRYFQEIEALFNKTHSFTRKWNHPLYRYYPHQPELIIIIGSQKGLCGNFNTSIFNTCKQLIQHKQAIECITVGRKAYDYAQSKLNIIPIMKFNSFSAQNYLTSAEKITSYIFSLEKSYSKITVVGSVAKSFFNQIPFVYTLFPLERPTQHYAIEDTKYIWDEPPALLLNQLLKQYIIAQLSIWLFETLVAEQAARFLSMDTSTRNAKNILETTQLLYNKLRQAKITKELIEFASAINTEDPG